MTGGSRGIGFASAERLAGEGASVVLCARDAQAVEKAAERLRDGGADAVGLSVDVGDERSVHNLVEEVEKRFSQLHILVNSAGIAPRVDGHKGSIETIP